MYRCLSDRIAGTLRGELAAGRYGPGRDFPSVDALRQRFGAGEYAVRHALQRLRADGLLIHRQGMGTMPTPKASCTFKGRVAFVCPGQAGGFFRIALAIRLAQRFREAGWDFASVFLPITENGDSASRMVRGGGAAWDSISNNSTYFRASYRSSLAAGTENARYGFRVYRIAD